MAPPPSAALAVRIQKEVNSPEGFDGGATPSRKTTMGVPSPRGPSKPTTPKLQQKMDSSRLNFTLAESTEAVRKINGKAFETITSDEFQQLFDALAKGNSGRMPWRDLANFFAERLEPAFTETELEAILRFTGVKPDGTVTPEDLKSAFTNPAIKLQLMQLHRKNEVDKDYMSTKGVSVEVPRELLVERLNWKVQKDDAFATLPFSLIFTLLFLSLVMWHLQIWQRQQVQRGLESWIEGYGEDLTGPFLKQAVAGTASCWAWLSSSGMLATFGECANESGTPLCRLATQNVLIGDAQLRQARAEGPERAVWLLHSEVAEAHLQGQPLDYLGAARATLRQLKGSDWIDDDTDGLQLVFSTYNEDANMFATTEVTVGFDSTGFVEPVVVSAAVTANPYPDWGGYLLDALYVCCILYPLYIEVKDLMGWIRTVGCIKGVKSYCSFWNAMDWTNICMGFVQSFNWIVCCFAISAESIQDLLDERSTLVTAVMGMETESLEVVRKDLSSVINLFFWLHVTMAVNVFSIMIKFFKAFQANPKLQLVTSTLTHAANDIFHFCVVAFSVFLGYAAIGHILFGGDIVAFNSLRRSMNTVFIVLMGEFSWYTQEATSDFGLGSGMPWFLVALWFWSFMVLCFLVLTNMLMAIILEYYADCFAEVKQNPDACALWVQAGRFAQQQLQRRKKGFVNQESVLCQLIDESNKVHPDDTVTESSLKEAFGMPAEQAETLAAWLRAEAARRAAENEANQDSHLARLVQVEGFLEGLMEMLHITSLNVSQCCRSLKDRPDGASDASMEQAARLAKQLQEQSATMADLDQVASTLRDVLSALSPKLPEKGGLEMQPKLPWQQREALRAAAQAAADLKREEG